MPRARDRIAAVVVTVFLGACSSESVDPPRELDAAAPVDAITATWRLDPSVDLTPDTTEFVALVTNPTCNGEGTGRVYAPEIDYLSDWIVVTFKVDPAAGSGLGACVVSEEVPYTVELDRPLGSRLLMDGDCEGVEAPPPGSRCDATRWNR